MARSRSLWLDEVLALPGEEDASPLRGRDRADVCIVGGGYTGLWTALRCKELDPSADVVVIEADVCGGGASGRNGGFVLSWWPKFATLRKLCGTDEALRLARASADAVIAIGSFCEANGIDAAYHRDGYLWAATNPAQIGSWRSTVDALDALGEHPFEAWTPEEVARRSGSAQHLAGVFEPTAAAVQPALLARGLRRAALARDVRIFERSPVMSFAGGPVRTAAGSVVADRVVLATNAWAVAHPELRKRILVVGSDIVATPPIPDRLAEIGWKDRLAISDSRLLVHYHRTTDDGRIAFGKGGGALAFGPRVGGAFEGESRRARNVERHFRRLYPALADVPVVRSWTGPIDRSRTGLPFFGPLPGRPGILVGVGYSGNGVGPSYLGGRILASLALGRDDGWSGCGLVGVPPGRAFPPEPVRFAGGHLVRRAIEREERLRDEARTPGRITTALVGLAPAGLVPSKGDRIAAARPGSAPAGS
jgi:putative aminophosphonate oxidoreductase